MGQYRIIILEGGVMKYLQIAIVILFATTPIANAAETLAHSTSVLDQPATTTLPTRLGGQWYTPSRSHSQIWSLEKMDATKKTALLTFHSTRVHCSMLNVSSTITLWDGKKLEVVVDRPNDCFGEFRVELTRIDNTSVYEGRIEVVPLMRGAVPTLVTSVKP
jgi:hypothetical protein